MSIEARIVLPDEFMTICDYMDVSPRAFLEKFVRNILSFEDIDDRDGSEMALAIRYYLIYSTNRNRIYASHVRNRDALINKTILEVNPFLSDLIDNGNIIQDDELNLFIERWKEQWKKIEPTWQGDEASAYSKVEDDTKLFTVNRDIPPFEILELTTVSDIVLQKGTKECIRIESTQQVDHIIQSDVENKRLAICLKKGNHEIIPHHTIFITYVALSRLVIAECKSVICKDPIENGLLGIIQNSKGNVHLHINVTAVDTKVTEIGSLELSGFAGYAKILNSGPGNFVGSDLSTSEAEVRILDSGSVSIHVQDQLSMFLQGRGKLLLTGEPRIKEFVVDIE